MLWAFPQQGWELRRGGYCGPSLCAGDAAAGLGHLRPVSVSPSAHVQRKVLSPGSLLQWLGGASPLPKQLCLLLSTAHHRRSFSTAQSLMDLDSTDVVLPLLRWFPL